MTDTTHKMLEPFVAALGIANNEDLVWKVLGLAYVAGGNDTLVALPRPEPSSPEPKDTAEPHVTDIELGM